MVTSTISRDFVFRKTDDLCPQDRKDYIELFRQVFGKEMTAAQFEQKYVHTPRGYSYHGLMLVDGRIVGAYNIIPYRYAYFGAQRLFGLSADLMLAEEYRSGPFNVLKMAGAVYEKLKQDRISFVFGFPNDNAYQFTTRVLKWTDMGDLEFYALPLNIGAVRPGWKWASPLSWLGAYGLTHWPRRYRSAELRFGIEKVCDRGFERHRYRHEHCVLDLPHGGKCTYRICLEEDHVRTLYLIDVTPLTPGAFAQAVRAVHAVASRQADLILYVGRLPFRPYGLVKVPVSKRPREIRMCGKLLDRDSVDERVFDMEQWNVNMSNFDVR